MKELYLVTGAAGHLGSALVDQLLKAGKPVRALVLPKEKDLLPKGVDVFVGDVTQKESLVPFFANPDQKELIVLHCAGIVSIASKYSQKVYDVNVGGNKKCGGSLPGARGEEAHLCELRPCHSGASPRRDHERD